MELYAEYQQKVIGQILMEAQCTRTMVKDAGFHEGHLFDAVAALIKEHSDLKDQLKTSMLTTDVSLGNTASLQEERDQLLIDYGRERDDNAELKGTLDKSRTDLTEAARDIAALKEEINQLIGGAACQEIVGKPAADRKKEVSDYCDLMDKHFNCMHDEGPPGNIDGTVCKYVSSSSECPRTQVEVPPGSASEKTCAGHEANPEGVCIYCKKVVEI